MRTKKSSRHLTFVFTTCLALGSLAAVAAPPAAFAQQADQRGDSEIQSDVAYNLATAPQLQGASITSATIRGVVTLSGSVKDQAARDLAGSIARKVQGVTRVENNLAIGDQPAAPAPAATAEAPAQAAADDQQGPDPADANMAPADPAQNTPAADAQNAPPAEATQPEPAPEQAPSNDAADQNIPPPAAAPAPQPNGSYPQQPQQPAQRAYQPAPYTGAPVTIAQGTMLRVRLSEPIDSRHSKAGQFFQATAAGDIYVGGVLAVPRGAVFEGQVVDTRSNQGELKGSAGFAIKLNSIQLEGKTFATVTDAYTLQGPGKGGYTAGNTIGGAALGAVIGAIAGRGPGAAIGAVAGGATGAAVSSATAGPQVMLPAESVVTFHLAQPLTVQPVSPQEAQRLAASVPAPQPRPYRYARPRPAYYYGYPYYPPPPPPPAYYRY